MQRIKRLAAVELGKSSRNFDSVLKNRLNFLEEQDTIDGVTLRQEYAHQCFKSLLILQKELLEHEFMIGSQDNNAVERLVCIVICWGILPPLSLDCQERISLKYRHKPEAEIISIDQSCELSIEILKMLMEISCANPRTALGVIVAKRHMLELIVAAIDGFGFVSSSSSGFLQLFDRYVDSAMTGTIMILMMQCLSEARYIKSLSSIPSQTLSRIIMRKDGVISLFGCILPGNADQDEQTFSQLTKISMILSTLPADNSKALVYIESISSQLLQILKTPRRDVDRYAAAFVTNQLMASHPEAVRAYIIGPLCDSFAAYWEGPLPDMEQKDLDGNHILLGEEDVELTISVMHEIMVSVKAHALVSQFMSDYLTPLFHLYTFSLKSKCTLHTPVFEIIAAILHTIAEPHKKIKGICEESMDKCSALKRGTNGGVILSAVEGFR